MLIRPVLLERIQRRLLPSPQELASIPQQRPALSERKAVAAGFLKLLATVLTGVLSVQAADGQESYFYSGGKKQPLQVSESWVAARADDSADIEDLKGERAFDPKRRTGRVSRDVVIAPVRPGSSQTERQNLERTLKGKRGVKRALRAYATKSDTPMVETGDVLVQFRPEITREQAATILAENGAEIVRPLGAFAPNGYVARVTDNARNATEVANAIFERGVAVFSHPDFVAPAKRNFVPNDPRFEEQWYLNNTGSLLPQRKAGADIKAKRAWDLTRGSSSVTVAVLDDGFDLNHEEFQNGKVVFSYDYFNYDTDASSQTYDHHGTACAGLIAATANNEKGISGVAPECKLMLLKVGKTQGPGEPNAGATLYGSQTLADAFTAAADRGAAVISCSWEFLLFDVVKAAIQYAATQGRGGRGCVIFFSAGNDGAAITNEHAKLPEVIAVGATTALDVRASYSNFGPELDLVAPSSPQAFVGGNLDVLTTDRIGAAGYRDGDYTSFGGTSAACPIAAGVGALLVSKEPGLTRQQVYQRLTSTADKVDPDNAGYNANGFSQTYGYGRVNALRALAASDTTPPTLTISSPENSFSSREMPTISGYAYDYGSLLEPSVDLVIYQNGQYWNGYLWVDRPEGTPVPVAYPKPTVDENGQWTYTNLPTGADLRSGVYYINASVYDAAGNANTPVAGTTDRSFRIDRSPPTITIASPANGSVLTDVPEGGWIYGTATDDGGVERPELTVYLRRISDDAYWAGGAWLIQVPVALTASYTNENAWNCSSLPGIGADSARCMAAGTYELIAIAKDKAGNQAEVRTNITVEHTLTLPNVSFLAEQEGTLVSESGVSAESKLSYPPLTQATERIQSPQFLRLDPAGNYITGMAMSLPMGQYITPHPSVAIHKHTPAGVQLWRRERQRESVTVQSQGLESTRYYERFADDQEWIEITGLEHDGMYSLGAMEVDGQGNVYAALNLSVLQYRQYATSSSGSPLYANLVTPTSYVVVVKFDANGNVVWRRRIGPSDSNTDWYPTSGAMTIKPLADGSAAVLIGNSQYVSGETYSPSYSFNQTVLARVGATSGGFVKHFGTQDIGSNPLDVKSDAAGNFYLVTAEGPQFPAYFYQIPAPDHVIRKISDTGTVLKEIRIDHCDAPEEWTDMAVDPATGHIYIAGNHTISNEPTGRQVGMKFDLSLAAGQEMAWRTFAPAATASPYDKVHLALSTEGVFLGSNAQPAISERSNFTITRLAYSGTLTWSRKYSPAHQGFGMVGNTLDAMAADAAGNVYIVGSAPKGDYYSQSVVRKISGYGDIQFAKPFPENTYHRSNSVDLLLLPSSASPASIAVLAETPAPGSVLLFSNPAVVYPPITIPEGAPADQWVAAGSDVTFTVNASGSAPLSYQWRKHTAGGSVQNIPGATGPTLTISNAQLSDAGEYSVVVSNTVATPVTSRTARLTVEVTVLLSLSDALDTNGLTWTTGGDQPWRGQTSTSYDGTDAAVSGSTADGGTSWLETPVTGPGVLSFRWKVSSEPNYDKLVLYLDGELQTLISGEQGWAGYSLFVPSGSHTVRWVYEKDPSFSQGADRGWVDSVSFTPGQATPPQIDVQPVSVATTLGRDVYFTVVASGVGNLSYQWLKDGQEIPFATDPTLLVSAVNAESAGSYQVRVTAGGESVLSQAATLTISDDSKKPTVKMTAPSSNITVKEAALDVSGTAADNREVVRVYVVVDRPDLSYEEYLATGTDRWSATVTLSPGVNRVIAYSVDAAGNYSSAVVRTVIYQTPAVLTVNSIGQGAVFEAVGKKLKPAAGNSQRVTGKTVKLVAKPAKGFVCAGWSIGDDTAIAVPGAAFNLALSGDLTVTARFIPNPFPELAGTYSGIIEGAPASAANSGAFTFTVSSGGMLTGKLTYGNKQLPLKLALSADALVSGVLPRPGGAPLQLSVQVTSSGVQGSISDGSVTIAEFTGARVLSFTKKAPPDVEGRYTLLLDDADGHANGHALVQVTNTGKVSVVGALTGGDAFVIKTVTRCCSTMRMDTQTGTRSCR